MMHRTIGRSFLAALLALTAAEAGAQVRADGSVDWNRYYSSAETNAILTEWARRHPQLTKLYSIGASYLGAKLMVMEVAHQNGPPNAERPALYVDGNIHSGELTSSAVALYLIGHLLSSYGEDPRVTRLLDTRVLYIRPKFNPDGADLTLLKGVSLRSTVHPWDDDEDGQADEDSAEDLNGDGFITSMRVPDPDGRWRASPQDPRLMVRVARRGRAAAGGPFYRILTEGIDNDGDGRINEDGVGGLDMNRNFPRNWALPYKQAGAGPFPLSEPETLATVKFIDSHPNITGIVHGHTSGGFVYRLPSACDPSTFDKDDLQLIETLGKKYTETTGRPVRPSSTHPTRHRHGTLISWGYWDRGIIGWVPEYWPGLGGTELERLRYDDTELGGRYFLEWEAHDHPDLGKVEIGGWRRRFITQNPPAELLEKECALQVPWILYLAEQSPLLAMAAPRLEPLEDDLFGITVTVKNQGFLPTNLTQRGIAARVVRPVVAEIALVGAEIVKGKRRTSLGHLAGKHPVPDAERATSADARWVVRRTARDASVSITALSQKGGIVRSAPVPLRRPRSPE